MNTDLGVGHPGETQFLDEVVDSSLLLTLRDGGGQSQGGGETQVLPDGQRAHEHVLLRSKVRERNMAAGMKK